MSGYRHKEKLERLPRAETVATLLRTFVYREPNATLTTESGAEVIVTPTYPEGWVLPSLVRVDYKGKTLLNISLLEQNFTVTYRNGYSEVVGDSSEGYNSVSSGIACGIIEAFVKIVLKSKMWSELKLPPKHLRSGEPMTGIWDDWGGIGPGVCKLEFANNGAVANFELTVCHHRMLNVFNLNGITHIFVYPIKALWKYTPEGGLIDVNTLQKVPYSEAGASFRIFLERVNNS